VAVSSFEGAPWPCLWLGCWTTKIAITLDTVIRILLFRLGANGTGVTKKLGLQRAKAGVDAQHFDEALKAKS
jgi:hypothetical protein